MTKNEKAKQIIDNDKRKTILEKRLARLEKLVAEAYESESDTFICDSCNKAEADYFSQTITMTGDDGDEHPLCICKACVRDDVRDFYLNDVGEDETYDEYYKWTDENGRAVKLDREL